MERILKIAGIISIVIACYIGVRYVSATIQYACAVPEEDCPPPFALAAKLGYVVTGGSLVPFWTRE